MVANLIFEAQTGLHCKKLFHNLALAIKQGVGNKAVVVEIVVRMATQSVENHAPGTKRNFKSEIGFKVFARPERDFIAITQLLFYKAVAAFEFA